MSREAANEQYGAPEENMAHNQASTHKGVRNDHLREAVRTIDNITEATDCREAKPSLKCLDTTGCDAPLKVQLNLLHDPRKRGEDLQ